MGYVFKIGKMLACTLYQRYNYVFFSFFDASITGIVCRVIGRSVGWSITHSFDDPHGAPYWPTWPCLKVCLLVKDSNSSFLFIIFFYIFFQANRIHLSEIIKNEPPKVPRFYDICVFGPGKRVSNICLDMKVLR